MPARSAVSSTTASDSDTPTNATNHEDSEYSESRGKDSQPTIFAALEKQTPLQSSNKRAKDITDAITYFLAKDSTSFNAVERPGFKHLLHVLEPRYQIPAKSSFSRERVAKLYDAARSNAMHELKNSMDFYAATTDMWSSHGMTPYIGFTLRWINDQWVLQNRCLGTKYVPEEHTGMQLAQCLNEILSDWKLDERKMAAITTDNGANIVKAFKEKQWRNMTCFGHNLHLAITATIEKQPNVSRAIGVCKKVVAEFNMSWKRKKALP